MCPPAFHIMLDELEKGMAFVGLHFIAVDGRCCGPFQISVIIQHCAVCTVVPAEVIIMICPCWGQHPLFVQGSRREAQGIVDDECYLLVRSLGPVRCEGEENYGQIEDRWKEDPKA